MKRKSLLFAVLLVTAIIYAGCKKELYSPVTKPDIKISNANLSNSLSATDTFMVYTPFGLKHRSDIHLIENGYHLSHTADGHIQKIETVTGKMIEDFGVFTTSPANSGSALNIKNTVHTNFVPTTLDTNWDAYATVTQYKQAVQSTSTTWVVPHAPPSYSHAQAVFIFNGLQSADQTVLIQPVLQYGMGPAGGGNYWSIQNYYIVSGPLISPVFVGPVITVTPGTSLTGTITKSGTIGNYTYTSSFAGYTTNALTITNQSYNLLWGTETLETYNVLNNNDLPPDSAVKMLVSAGPSNTVTGWGLTNFNQKFGMHVKQVGNSEIDLYFHTPPPRLPIISYTSPDTYYTGFPITALSPVNTGSTPTSYSVSPALPTGLSLNTSTGVISGEPLGLAPSRTYIVTATNAAGNGTFPISITINQSNLFTFNIYSSNSSVDNFLLSVNGINEDGPHGVSQTNSLVGLPGYGYLTNSTIIMEITFGPMPTSATLYGAGAPINGVISGANITFNNCNLSSTTAVTIDIN